MKNILLLILVSQFFHSCKENKLDGVWLQVKNRPLTEKNGFSYESENSIMNFDKLERTDLGLPIDTILPFSIDFNNKTIRNDLNNKKFKYQLFKNDSLKIYYENDNLVEVFIPINLNKKINLEKTQVEDFLKNKQFFAADNKLKLTFSDENIQENSITDEYQSVRVLITKYLENDSSQGYWFIKEYNRSCFLVIDFDLIKQNVYHIVKVDANKMIIKGLNTEGIADDVKVLKSSKK